MEFLNGILVEVFSGSSFCLVFYPHFSILQNATLYQERAVFGKMKMDPAKRAQIQNAGEVSLLQWFFSQSVVLMTDKVWLHCIRPMLLK